MTVIPAGTRYVDLAHVRSYVSGRTMDVCVGRTVSKSDWVFRSELYIKRNTGWNRSGLMMRRYGEGAQTRSTSIARLLYSCGVEGV